jgi:hypothetical protein
MTVDNRDFFLISPFFKIVLPTSHKLMQIHTYAHVLVTAFNPSFYQCCLGAHCFCWLNEDSVSDGERERGLNIPVDPFLAVGCWDRAICSLLKDWLLKLSDLLGQKHFFSFTNLFTLIVTIMPVYSGSDSEFYLLLKITFIFQKSTIVKNWWNSTNLFLGCVHTFICTTKGPMGCIPGINIRYLHVCISYMCMCM